MINVFADDENMNKALIFSAALHLVIMLVSIVGLPFIKKPEPTIIELPNIIDVEFVTADGKDCYRTKDLINKKFTKGEVKNKLFQMGKHL